MVMSTVLSLRRSVAVAVCAVVASATAAVAPPPAPAAAADRAGTTAIGVTTSAASWGDGDFGQLGDGTALASPKPVRVSGLTGVSAVAGGLYSAYAVRSDGTAWAWGYNPYGGLGDGTTTDRYTPVRVGALTGVTAVAAASFTGYALTSDGTVWAWGDGFDGGLGNGAGNDSLVPVRVAGLTGVVAIAGQGGGGYALKSDGTVWAWGSNAEGQLGDGTTTTRLSPVQVRTLTGVRAIASATGAQSAYALKTDGTVWAWGSNSEGQLGDGTTTRRPAPVQVQGMTGATAIAAGLQDGYAQRSGRTLWSWGGNGYGQLGNGGTVRSTVPVRVNGAAGTTAIAAGGYTAYAVQGDGTVQAWGANFAGQVGDGSTTNRTAPVPVATLRAARSVSAGYQTAYAVSDTKPERLDVMQYNIAGATKNGGSFEIIGRVVDEVLARRPDVLSINEICSHQYDHLREELDRIGYQMHALFHAALRVNPTCGGLQEDGNAIFVLGDVLSEQRYYFDKSRNETLTEGQNGAPPATRWQTVGCLTTRFSNPGLPVKVCTTHLGAKNSDLADPYAVPRRQAAELARVLGPEARQSPLVLAGDFNLPLGERALDPLYNAGLLGAGPFAELATTVQDGNPAARRATNTHSEGKLDYVFASHFTADIAASGVVDHGENCDGGPCSDHRMLYGALERQVVTSPYTTQCPYRYTCLFADRDFGGRQLALKGCDFRDLADFGFRDTVSSWAHNHPADDVPGRAFNAGDGQYFPLWTMGPSAHDNAPDADDNVADAVDPCDDGATP